MRRLLLLLALAAAAGCATSSAFRAGETAERVQDYDRAVLEYRRALKESPDNLGYKQALERARLRAATEHTNSARRFAGRGPVQGGAGRVPDRARAAAERTRHPRGDQGPRGTPEARRRLPAAGARTGPRREPCRGLDLGPDAQQPLGLVFRGASLREAYLALGRAAGVNVTFDPSFQDTTVSLDLRDVGFEQALSALDAAGRTFHRVRRREGR